MIRQFEKTSLGELLQRIYDSQIGIRIYWSGNSGIDWEINDGKKNRRETSGAEANFPNSEWEKIEYSMSALAYEIYRLHPESSFAKWYVSLPSPADPPKL